jgi:large subunit ribosomal protein L4e
MRGKRMVKKTINIINTAGKESGKTEFNISCDIRVDIFKKAVLSERSWFKQTYGANSEAGKRQVIHNSKRRKRFRTTYGRGGSRAPKKVMWKRGTQLRYVGAFAPGTVGGRKAHPPKAGKIGFKNINNKEWIYALKIGFFSSLDKNQVEKNGQSIPQNYPFVLDESFDKIKKTKEIVEIFEKLGFSDEFERVSKKKIRAGKGKARNRKYKIKRGPLIVVDPDEENLVKSTKNLLGFEVIDVDSLIVSDFGMSEIPGRCVLFTKKASEKFKEVIN